MKSLEGSMHGQLKSQEEELAKLRAGFGRYCSLRPKP